MHDGGVFQCPLCFLVHAFQFPNRFCVSPYLYKVADIVLISFANRDHLRNCFAYRNHFPSLSFSE